MKIFFRYKCAHDNVEYSTFILILLNNSKCMAINMISILNDDSIECKTTALKVDLQMIAPIYAQLTRNVNILRQRAMERKRECNASAQI